MSAEGWVLCANEHDTHPCMCPHGTVRYGDADSNTWAPTQEVVDSIHCTNAQFGDPFNGTRKTCQCNKYAPYEPDKNPGCKVGADKKGEDAHRNLLWKVGTSPHTCPCPYVGYCYMYVRIHESYTSLYKRCTYTHTLFR